MVPQQHRPATCSAATAYLFSIQPILLGLEFRLGSLLKLLLLQRLNERLAGLDFFSLLLLQQLHGPLVLQPNLTLLQHKGTTASSAGRRSIVSGPPQHGTARGRTSKAPTVASSSEQAPAAQ